MKKITIEQVSNGYIVRVLNDGESIFKQAYDMPISVYIDVPDLISQLQWFFQIPIPVEPIDFEKEK